MHSCLSSLQATKNVALAIRMYDVCVRPVATYASAVWAPKLCAVEPARVSEHLLEAGHLRFLRRWCRLRQNVPVWAVYAELGRLPLQYFWAREICKFFNALVALPAGSVWHDVLVDNLAVQASGRQNWSAHVLAFLSSIGYLTGPLPLQSIDVDEVLQCMQRRYSGVWEGLGMLPRMADSRVRLTTYCRWFAGERWLHRPAYLFLKLGHRSTYLFVRFKLGCHDLGIEAGRWNGTPRCQRLCPRCDQGELDDERHLVFECPCFEPLRREYRHLFTCEIGFDMRRFFAQKDQFDVVVYILACLRFIDALGG